MSASEKLAIKMNPDFPFHQYCDEAVTLVALRGSSFTTGTHHELMLTLANGILLRISRNNASDTFQIGAEGAGPRGALPVLASAPPRHRTTVRDALAAFGDVNRQMPRYEQGDCQAFAAQIYKALTGLNASGMDTSYEDDFM